MLSSYFNVSQVLRQTYIETMQPRPSRKERKLDRLKMNPMGATKEAPICAVPTHAPQTNSLWQGVGEVSSAGEVGC